MRQCSECGESFESIGKHWRWKSDHKPSFTKKQLDILKGVMMGDGTLHKKNDKNPYVLVAMTNDKYLDYLKQEFESLGKDVYLKQTAEESAEAMRNNGLRPNAKAKNYKPVYKWATRSHEDLKFFKQWYDGSDKIIPANFNLSPTVLRHWYVCDGHLQTKGNHYRCSIALTDQRKNRKAINKLFTEADLPLPKWFERDTKNKRTEIVWNKEKSTEILKYMDFAPPGFDYKWP